MRTREEFVARWRSHVAGLALYGLIAELSTPADRRLSQANRALEIPGQVERLLGQMYDDLARQTADRAEKNGVKQQ